MTHFKYISIPAWLISLFLIILFSPHLKVFAGFQEVRSYKEPSLSYVLFGEDSILTVPQDISGRDIFYHRKFILPHRSNNIAFEFSQAENVMYQCVLKGFDRKWTNWKNINRKEYTNLPAGQYTFKMRYMVKDEMPIEGASFVFLILPVWFLSSPAIIFYVVLLLLLIWALYAQLNLRFACKQFMLEQIINIRTEDLIIEKEKTEALLVNVLPKNTAEEIMLKGKASKIKYNFVTVLFSDIQGFTTIAEEMNPEVLIDELDKFFFSFDSVVEKYGIEKIKTIGDAYMCAGGIPEKNRTNPVEVILAALEMKTYMEKLKETSLLEGMKYWDIRIGIHTGTVVAGVVGHKKLSYDIWGDTVNTASRMESSGEAGKINISGTTYEFVKDFFICEFRGKMPVKYKGELEMYFVEGIIPGLRDENGGPNGKFITKMQLIKIEDVEEMIIKMFDEEAPPNLYFHNSLLVRSINNHVELLSTAEKLPEEDFINLKLAAVFLFTGYIFDYEKPMEASFRLVEEILPRYGFDQSIIEIVRKLIKNSFSGTLESVSDNILHDARYDYLGRVDYVMLTKKLLRESKEYGYFSDMATWISTQQNILSEHEFITSTAKLMRTVQVDQQISALLLLDE